MDQQKEFELLLEKAKDFVSEHLVLGTYQDDIKRELKKNFGLTYSVVRKGDGVIRLHLFDPAINKGKKFIL